MLNNLNKSQYITSIFSLIISDFLSSPRSGIDRMRVPCTVAMADEILLESAVRVFYVYHALSCSAYSMDRVRNSR